MLSFKEFQEYVMDHIREYLPEEYANAGRGYRHRMVG